MNTEFFIARKIKTGGNDSDSAGSSPILNIALLGIVLAVVIMILSIVVVQGFKSEITTKIFNLTPHITISRNDYTDLSSKTSPVDISEMKAILDSMAFIHSYGLIADKPAVLKTESDFYGLTIRGVDTNYNSGYYKTLLTEGRLPIVGDTESYSEICLSSYVARRLDLNVGDKILTYFIDDAIRVRNLKLVGIFNSDFEDFDNNFAFSPISLIQGVNKYSPDEGSSIAIYSNNTDNLSDDTYGLYREFANRCVALQKPMNYVINNSELEYGSYFAWLKLLDSNIIIILVLMSIVAGFTLIAGLLIIVLGHIKTIGLLKSLGSTNKSIRNIFILVTQKLIFKALLIGNVVGIGLAMIQHHFKVVALDSTSYYMSFVPVKIEIWQLLALNIGVVIVAYITLIIPSYIITTISPTSALRYE